MSNLKEQIQEQIQMSTNHIDQFHDTLTSKTPSLAAWIGTQATAWAITFADINALLTSLSLMAATALSIYMIYLKYKEVKSKK